MKQIFLILAAMLLLAACDAESDFAPTGEQAQFSTPEGIEAIYATAAFSYAPDGEFMSADKCTDQGTGTYTLATRADLCLRIAITNTTKTKQTVNRRDFAMDFDGRATRTPSAFRQTTINPGDTITIVLNYESLPLVAYPQWQQVQDVNALYSLDLRLGASATYLYGCDIYLTYGHNEYIKR
jgi:hypothetical protein